MSEDPAERKQWDRMVRDLADGDRLKMIRHQLMIMAAVTPQPKLKLLYAVMANDASDLIEERDGKDKEPTWQR